MKKMATGLIASLLLLPMTSFAQSIPQAPASWVAFQKQENAKRAAFYKQMKDDKEAFLRANPDVKSYFEQMHTAANARKATWRAAHPRKI